MAVVKPHGRFVRLFKSLSGSVHRFTGGFGKGIFSSHSALEQLLNTTVRASMEICENF
jgi:hypothetical protein